MYSAYIPMCFARSFSHNRILFGKCHSLIIDSIALLYGTAVVYEYISSISVLYGTVQRILVCI